jgi:oxaloacetate decarboxylase gamma subunit
MTIIEMLQQSAILTVLGMAVVFVFLWVMIACVNGVGTLVRRFGWDKDVQVPKNEAPGNTGRAAPGVTAAISAAVSEYRKKQPD